jgi:2-amino-4-hydroxy-6-hydroxymethyldihydropteridine diphosphokinase
MSTAVTAYLLLGSNLGNRPALLAAAWQQLAAAVGPITAASALYETAAWGREDQPAYLNQALALTTHLEPLELLTCCQAVEQAAGRERIERWGSRTLDVDILLFGDAQIDLPTLTVPHPRLAERRFALVPLAEIAPDLVVPGYWRAVSQLLGECPDMLPVQVARTL